MKKVKLKWDNILIALLVILAGAYGLIMHLGYKNELEKNKVLEEQMSSIQNERALEYSQYQNAIRQNEALEYTVQELNNKIIELEDIIENN